MYMKIHLKSYVFQTFCSIGNVCYLCWGEANLKYLTLLIVYLIPLTQKTRTFISV